MFSLYDLPRRIVAAPMAGGPSTPELAAAVSEAGGLGFLAAGYLAADVLEGRIARLQDLTPRPFGVNLFVPDAANTQETASTSGTGPDAYEAAAQYRGQLLDEQATGALPPTQRPLPLPDATDDDGWEAKLGLVLDMSVPVVSFTFGVPSAEVVGQLHEAGSAVVITVTDPDEAEAAVGSGARILCVQGPDAGGHRGTLRTAAEPGTDALPDLLEGVRTVLGDILPGPRETVQLIAAGGISGPAQVAELLSAGADAVQVGTALLLAPEAGTHPLHRQALAGERFADTSLTRAFSGRWARGLTNDFMRRHRDAPAAYPLVNQITRPLRAEAAERGDADLMSLWAGRGFREARPLPAAEIVEELWGGVR